MSSKKKERKERSSKEGRIDRHGTANKGRKQPRRRGRNDQGEEEEGATKQKKSPRKERVMNKMG